MKKLILILVIIVNYINPYFTLSQESKIKDVLVTYSDVTGIKNEAKTIELVYVDNYVGFKIYDFWIATDYENFEKTFKSNGKIKQWHVGVIDEFHYENGKRITNVVFSQKWLKIAVFCESNEVLLVGSEYKNEEFKYFFKILIDKKDL